MSRLIDKSNQEVMGSNLTSWTFTCMINCDSSGQRFVWHLELSLFLYLAATSASGFVFYSRCK